MPGAVSVDGCDDDLTGKSFVFEYEGGPPYNVTIQMDSNVSLSQYRFYSQSIYTSRVKYLL